VTISINIKHRKCNLSVDLQTSFFLYLLNLQIIPCPMHVTPLAESACVIMFVSWKARERYFVVINSKL